MTADALCAARLHDDRFVLTWKLGTRLDGTGLGRGQYEDIIRKFRLEVDILIRRATISNRERA
ncbi:hypothetical protein BGZ75_002931, partial [Mortierella antarctica]